MEITVIILMTRPQEPSDDGFPNMLAKLVLEHSPLALCVFDALSNADASAVPLSHCRFFVSSELFINGSPLSTEYWLTVYMAAENHKIMKYITNYGRF